MDTDLALLCTRDVDDDAFVVVLYDHNVVNSCLTSGFCVPCKVVTAALETRHCDGLECISYVVAKQGYGPFVYDVALQHCPAGLAPDRCWVSAPARKVWEYYRERRIDVVSQPINVDTKLHDVECLDRVYVMKERRWDLSALRARHDHLVSLHGDVTSVLRRAGLAVYNRHK